MITGKNDIRQEQVTVKGNTPCLQKAKKPLSKKGNENVFMQLIMSLITHTRGSHRRCTVRKGVLRKFAKFTGKHLCQSLFF